MVNNKQLSYSIQKDTISIYYKDIVDNPLTEGKTAEELIKLVKELDLPEIKEINYLRTTVSKIKNKYRVIALLKYNSDEQGDDRTLTLYDTIEEYDKPTTTLTIVKTKYVIISDDDGVLVVEGL